jgi:hypothetical protein
MANTEDLDRLVRKPICSAAKALKRVPPKPGYYAIFIDSPGELPHPFSKLLVQRKTKLIYIGIARASLYRRLVEQDLSHKEGESTFFRGIGAILSFRPPVSSLVGRRNQNNYRFSRTDTEEIISWIQQHLRVGWIEEDPALETEESRLIEKHCPIINTKYNPNPVPELASLRSECRTLACSRKA